MKDKYVVNNERQKNFLYCLGFDYTTKKDKFNELKIVWLFEKTDELLEAIDFYCKFRCKMQGINR